MKIFDLHQDLMSHVRFRDKYKQSYQTDFVSLSTSEVDLVVATAFPLPESNDQLDPQVPTLIEEELRMYLDYAATHDDWTVVRTAHDIDSTKKKLLLHIEGVNVFTGSDADWAMVERWIDLGVRSIGTHWNISNNLGAGTLDATGSLTELGMTFIEFLEQKNVVFDLAHMGRNAFFEAAKVATRPLYVSHVNADTICPHVRNCTDEQLELVAESGGVVGVFFADTFVTGGRGGVISDVVAHISHMRDLMGVDHIALGSDFGGLVTGTIKSLSNVTEFQNLFEALTIAGYSDTDIEKIAYKNAERILKNHLSGK